VLRSGLRRLPTPCPEVLGQGLCMEFETLTQAKARSTHATLVAWWLGIYREAAAQSRHSMR
jgi:hypothetical protein